MASQEQLHSMLNDDDDSSTSTSSTTSSATSSEHNNINNDDDDATKASKAATNRSIASAPADDDEQDESDHDDASSTSTLKPNRPQQQQLAPEAPTRPLAPPNGRILPTAKNAASSSKSTTPKVKVKPKPKPSSDSSSSGPMKKRIKLSLKKSPSSSSFSTSQKDTPKSPGPGSGISFLKSPHLAMKRKALSSGADGTVKKKKKKTQMVLPTRKSGGLPTTPKLKKSKKPKSAARSSTEGSANGEIKAMVVASDDEDTAVDDVVVAVVEEQPGDKPKKPSALAPKKKAPAPTSVAASILPTLIPTPNLPTRPIRLPSMSSPGLLLPSASALVQKEQVKDNLNNEDKNSQVWSSPSCIFDHVMSLAGYTPENRVHRGSSVTRRVGDMFDADVQLSLHPPKLVPVGLLHSRVVPAVPGMIKGEENSQPHTEEPAPTSNADTISDMLLRALQSNPNSSNSEVKSDTSHDDDDAMEIDSEENTKQNGTSLKSRARRKLLGFADMAPLSLTLPYPESYIERHLEYVSKVQEREKAIVKFQDSCDILDEKIFNDPETYLDAAVQAKARQALSDELKALPEIPSPPSPPRIEEMPGIDKDKYEDAHPFYPPKPPTLKEKFVDHLDKACFHITQGRYFGPLTSNRTADPHFCGPTAPGIVGLSSSVANGLATAYTGGGSASVAAASVLVQPTGSATSGNKSGSSASKVGSSSGGAEKVKLKLSIKPSKASENPSTGENGSKSGGSSAPTKKSSSSGSGGSKKKKNPGPEPTATLSEFRKAMDADPEMGEKLRDAMIRAAVHGSRTNQHSQSFWAPDGNVYPDVSRAFAAFAGLKPCARCKNNKQGAYHCRLRRKHMELDFDGNNSVNTITPFFDTPVDELLYKPGD